MSSLIEDRWAVRQVARAIASAVAAKVAADDPKLASLDALGRMMAENTMADGMVESLVSEATSAILAVERLQAEAPGEAAA